MNAQDYMNFENNRADAIAGLIDFCMTHNLNYSYTEKKFSITLPYQEPLPTAVDIPKPKRTSFNTDNWPSAGVDETDTDKPLDEGMTP